jgi:hypothetical protein
MSDFETFVALELPRRPTLLTVVITGFDGDPNDGGAPAIISDAPVGTFYLRETPVILYQKQTPSAYTPVGGGASSSFVYQQGGGGVGPVVFEDWATLVSALDDARVAGGPAPGGAFDILFDDSIVTPLVVPSGAADMTAVNWKGLPRPGEFRAAVSVSEGASFTRLRKLGQNIEVTFTGATPAVADFTNNDVFSVDGVSRLQSTGTGPFIDIGAVVCFVLAEDGSFMASGTTPTVNLSTGATVLALPTNNSIIGDDFFSGVVGSVLFFSLQEASSTASLVQPAFLGVRDASFDGTTRWNPFITRTTFVTSVNAGAAYKFDTSSGAIPQTMPDADTFYNGDTVFFKKDAGVEDMIFTPFAGNTFDGSTDPILLSPSDGSVLFMRSEIDADWTVLHLDKTGTDYRITPIQTSVVTAAIGQIVRCDPSAGGFVVNLPTISTLSQREVSRDITVKNVTGSVNAITITRGGGDTIEGATTLVINTARGFFRLVPNGATDWMVV